MVWDMGLEKATFSAGKFWGVQFYFDQIPGVIKSRVGYIGGSVENPTEEMVQGQNTGHTEAVEIEYDSDLINYDTLLKHFFRIHDPTQRGGQGKDIGDQFRSVIYYHTEDQKIVAEIVLNSIRSRYSKPVLTQLIQASTFYEAAPIHQKYTQTTGRGAENLPVEDDQR